MAGREGNLHFFPDRVEAIGGDSINHRNKRLASRQTGVRLKYKVEGCVVLKKRLFGGRREFHELDVEQVVVVIGRYGFARAACASDLRGHYDRDRQACPGDQFKNVIFHSFALVFGLVGTA